MWDRRVSIEPTLNENSGLSTLEPLMELIIEHCTGKCNHSIGNEMVRKHDEREVSSDEDVDAWLKEELSKHMTGQDKEEAEDALIDILKIVVEECKSIYKKAQIRTPSSRTSEIHGVSFVADEEEGDVTPQKPGGSGTLTWGATS
ncbi:hypothetical protein Tco_0344849 [Tanacetum coccineum]